MGIMGNSIWGPGFSIVDARRKKLLKRIVATPMPKHYYLLSFLVWRMILLPVDVGVPLGFGILVLEFLYGGRLLHWWGRACWLRSPSAREAY
jgi:ABC-2 type transport system permease protein